MASLHRFLRAAPIWVLLLFALGMGGLGGLLLGLGLDEQVPVLSVIGVALLGSAAASLIMAGIRGVPSAARRLRHRARQRSPRRRRVALGIAAVLVLPAALALHNFVVWRSIEKDCVTALRTPDMVEGRRAYSRARRAMQQRLLVIPSSVFDLWGPNRCRSARKRYPGLSD